MRLDEKILSSDWFAAFMNYMLIGTMFTLLVIFVIGVLVFIGVAIMLFQIKEKK